MPRQPAPLRSARRHLSLGLDLFHFIDPGTGAEPWLGRETPFDPWATWDDLRRHYPGPAVEILDPGDFADPGPRLDQAFRPEPEAPENRLLTERDPTEALGLDL